MRTIDQDFIQKLTRAAHALEVEWARDVDETAEVPYPEPGPPATEAQLSELAEYLREQGLPFPPSYRAFLSVCDGIKNFRPSPFGDSLRLLAIEEVMSPPHPSQPRMFPALARFNVARGESLEFIAFDADVVNDGEAEVVEISAEGEASRYPSFDHFLHHHLETLARQLARSEASSMARTKTKPKPKPKRRVRKPSTREPKKRSR